MNRIWMVGLMLLAAVLPSTAMAARDDVVAAQAGEEQTFPPPEVTDLAPSRTLLRSLAVLRRAQRASDVPSNFADFVSFSRAVSRRYMRYLGRSVDGERQYLVPFVMRGRPVTREFLRLGVFDSYGGGGGWVGGGDLRDGFLVGTAQDSSAHPSVVTAVVPDGVARVVTRYRGNRIRANRVRNNMWSTRVGLAAECASPQSTSWYDATGRRIRHFRDADAAPCTA